MISKRIATILILTPIVMSMTAGTAAAQATDEFEVGVLVGNDNPPTTPANFSVTPITATQIDLAWDASSDDFGVSGYQIFRDGSAIATTTLTSYSDTGLTASTTYAYFIQAFDSSLNYSTSTATLSTSTPAAPEPELEPEAGAGGVSGFIAPDIEILDLSAEVTTGEVIITFTTNQYVQSETRWGRVSPFDLGYILSDAYKKQHVIAVDGLEAGVDYQFQIVLRDQYGSVFETELSYTTDSRPDQEPPTNATNFTATLTEQGVSLTWENPAIADFSHVRVVSNDAYYPLHIADGWQVYDGTGEATLDDRLLAPDSARYYSLYVYDASGNISSGAVARVRGKVPVVTDANLSTATSTDSDTVSTLLDFSKIEFLQVETPRGTDSAEIVLSGNEETLVRVPYELFPERLKSIVMHFTHPNDSGRTFSFLLKVNKDKTYYEARLAPFQIQGVMPVVVSVFDYEQQEITESTGFVTVEYKEPSTALSGIISAKTSQTLSLSLTISLLLLLLLLFLIRRRQEEG